MIDILCDEECVPKSFLGKIFQNLSKSGLVGSARGSGGGFYLTRPASDITVLEILESIEGPIALQRCLEIDVGCEHSSGCALCGLLAEAQLGHLGRTPLAQWSGSAGPFGSKPQDFSDGL